MGGSERDFGGVVQGISEALKEGMASGFTTTTKKRAPASLERAAESEQAPGRALPDPAIRTTPKKFGKFATRK